LARDVPEVAREVEQKITELFFALRISFCSIFFPIL